MWATLRRILTRNSRILTRDGRCNGSRNSGRYTGAYRVRSYPVLRPWHVRGRRFTTRWRGLDPAEVHTFLDWVATDLARVYDELARSREETARIKDALREWQSRQAPTAYELARR